MTEDMEKSVLYKYIKLDLEQFAMFEENMPSGGLENLQYHTGTSFQYDKSKNVICNTITVTFTKSESILLKAAASSYFEIPPDSVKELTDDKGRIIFPIGTLIQFSSFNYGALRGMLSLKTSGTVFSNYILPPIFFNEIINEEYVVD